MSAAALKALDDAIDALGGPAVVGRKPAKRAPSGLDSRGLAAALEPQGVRLLRGDSVKLESASWIWRNYLPAGMLIILGGAPGCGKTTILMSLAATVTKGGCWPDGSRCDGTGDVLIWSGEDPPSVLAGRLHAHGADMSRVHFIDGKTGAADSAFDPGCDMALLEDAAAKLTAPRLLILDPVVSAVAGDSHKGAEVRRSLQPVVNLAHRIGCAVVGITHFSKGTAGRDPVERITGSIAFAALARVVLVAAKVQPDAGEDGEPRRVLMRAKSNIGPDDGGFAYELERVEVAPGVEGQRVRWLEALQGSARELLADAETDNSSDDGSTAAGVDAFLLGLLEGGPMPAKTIKGDADGAGYAWRTVQRSAHRLGIERRKDGMRGGWVWALSDADTARRCHEGAIGATQKVQAPSASSGLAVAPSDDVEVL